jgi:hypothetical protein
MPGCMERQAGLEPATSTMGRWHATACITDAWSTRRELNPLHPRWRRGILPVNYWCVERQAGPEPATPALATRCSTAELLPQGSAPGTRTPTVTVNSRSHYHCASAEGMRYIGMVQAARVELAPCGLRDRRSANRATPGWIGDRTRTCILRVRTALLASPRAPPTWHGRKGSNLHASG